MGNLAAIIPAAGKSSRFGAQRNKLMESLGGKAVLLRTLEAFARRADVSLIVMPTDERMSRWIAVEEHIRSAIESHGPRVQFCQGGPSRAQSVRNALERVPASIEWVAVHDAARPLVSQALIDRTFAAARQHGAAVPAMPVHLTIKQAQGPLPARVQRTIPRQTLWAMQTPQIMRRAALQRAYAACPIPLAEVTDDAQLLELAGDEVWLVEGEEANLKITTAADMGIAEMLLRPP